MTNMSSRLYSSLEADLTDQGLPTKGDFWPGMTIKEAAALNICSSFLKKWEHENTSETDNAALKKFLTCNQACAEWSLPVQYDWKTEMLLGDLKTVISSFWYRNGLPLFDHPYDLLSKGKIGPGSNLGALGGDFYTKFFSSPLTTSSDKLYFWYRRYIQSFPEWVNGELTRISSFGSASVLRQSRLSFVPKNDKISRCICVEPTLNTFFQLGLASHLELRLAERFGISLADQQFKNRDLARLGSMTDGLSTIDLSSASDSISIKMLKYLLPTEFYEHLMLYRTPNVEVPGLGTQPLHMISTMGNGFTFPLQTMLFSCVVAAALRFRGIPLNRKQSDELWGVFGDDIICPKLVTSDVIHLLNILGFVVNSDKTFTEGPFRESCGSDFYLGTNIRGIYLKRLDTMASRFSAFNTLVRWSVTNGIHLPKTLSLLYSSVKVMLVPRWMEQDSGIHCPSYLYPSHVKDPDTQGVIFHALRPRLPRIRVTEDGFVVPRSNKARVYNSSGLLTAFLQGSVNAGSIGTRYGVVKYQRKRLSTSSWDAVVPVERDREGYGLDWRRWESVLEGILETGPSEQVGV